MRKHLVVSLFCMLLCYTLVAEARTALVIGNGDYQLFSSLAKPVEEAQLLASALKHLGFEVILVTDADKEAMANSLRIFRDKVKEKGGIALFHYGGHAVQIEGKNYLIPVDADIDAEYLIQTRSLDSAEIMLALEYAGAEANIVILDSCRNNPLPSVVRDGTRGLAVVSRKPKNSIIVYSAESGTVARDGIFTPVFVDMLQIPGLDLAEVIMRTRKEVYIRTGGKQTPGEYNQLFNKIYLNGIPVSDSELITKTESDIGTVTEIVPDSDFEVDDEVFKFSSNYGNHSLYSSSTYFIEIEEVKENGTLCINVNESGKLYINGAFIQEVTEGASVSVNLAPGFYRVEVKLETGRVLKRSVDVFSNEISQITLNIEIDNLLKKREQLETEYASKLVESDSFKKAGWSTFGVSLASIMIGSIIYGCGADLDAKYHLAVDNGEPRADLIDLYQSKADCNTAGSIFMGVGSASLFTSIGFLVSSKTDFVKYYEKKLGEIDMQIKEAGGDE